jgi:hypothetical protein
MKLTGKRSLLTVLALVVVSGVVFAGGGQSKSAGGGQTISM